MRRMVQLAVGAVTALVCVVSLAGPAHATCYEVVVYTGSGWNPSVEVCPGD